MYKQKGSAKKPKAMSYFNQFPANFLRPYGKADPAPEEETIGRHHLLCEWFMRPNVAMSEIADTITENIEILHGKDVTYVDRPSSLKWLAKFNLS